MPVVRERDKVRTCRRASRQAPWLLQTCTAQVRDQREDKLGAPRDFLGYGLIQYLRCAVRRWRGERGHCRVRMQCAGFETRGTGAHRQPPKAQNAASRGVQCTPSTRQADERCAHLSMLGAAEPFLFLRCVHGVLRWHEHVLRNERIDAGTAGSL